MKLTKATLKQLIQQELKAVLAETLSAEKQAKLKKLKKKKNKSKEDKEEEKSLQHQWMKEGKLSSALVKRFQLKESVGKVLWHSLDKHGRINEYDMQFGDTIVKGLLPENIEPVVVQEHKHFKRDDRE